jgi:hypothetical protein
VRVTTRVKIYDRKCLGLGVYNLETYHRRRRQHGLRAMDPAALAETFREQKAQTTRRGHCSSFARIVA